MNTEIQSINIYSRKSRHKSGIVYCNICLIANHYFHYFHHFHLFVINSKYTAFCLFLTGGNGGIDGFASVTAVTVQCCDHHRKDPDHYCFRNLIHLSVTVLSSLNKAVELSPRPYICTNTSHCLCRRLCLRQRRHYFPVQFLTHVSHLRNLIPLLDRLKSNSCPVQFCQQGSHLLGREATLLFSPF